MLGLLSMLGCFLGKPLALQARAAPIVRLQRIAATVTLGRLRREAGLSCFFSWRNPSSSVYFRARKPAMNPGKSQGSGQLFLSARGLP